MPTLHNAINSLAETFAHDLLRALRGASLEDIISETSAGHVGRRGPGRPPATHAAAPKRTRKREAGRLARRSAEDIAKALAQVISLVKTKKAGLRSEEIRKALKLDKREVPRVLKEGLAKKTLRAKGRKRATTYYAG